MNINRNGTQWKDRTIERYGDQHVGSVLPLLDRFRTADPIGVSEAAARRGSGRVVSH